MPPECLVKGKMATKSESEKGCTELFHEIYFKKNYEIDLSLVPLKLVVFPRDKISKGVLFFSEIGF